MSWIKKLNETYDYCSELVGAIGADQKTPLLPIAHSTQNAQIEMVIDETGEFLRARVLEKNESSTIIPVTEDSVARSSGIAPHPLCDKLQYVAGDYCRYVEKKKAREYYDQYFKKLEAWCRSEYSSPKIQAITSYLKKESVISDLVNNKILIMDDNGRLDKGIKLGVGLQSEAFIRFRVESPLWQESAVWLDRDLYTNYSQYYLNSKEDADLCYVSGKEVLCSDKHPAKVRNTADKAKLISSNLSDGFTFRGRLSDKTQVMSIGYEASQKAHNALRWLIDQQGYRNGDQAIVAWGTRNQNIPGIFEDSFSILYGSAEEKTITTEKEFSKRLNRAIAGYGSDLDTKSQVVVMGVDSATTGRLSITFYRELNGSDFLERIKTWHRTCSWRHSYRKIQAGEDKKGKIQYKWVEFVGAPSPRDIFFANYGAAKDKSKEKLRKATIERLLPCIVDGAKLPYDLINPAINRTTRPYTMDSWEWEKTLTITCALIKKIRNEKFKEEWEMALDENQRDRSYLFGRLLAIAEQVERFALYTAGENRTTNAERLMHQYKIHPYKTWGILNDKLRPYISRLGSKGQRLVDLMAEVNAMLSFEDFTEHRRLDDVFLLGYYCQRQVFVEEKNHRIEMKKQLKLNITEEN